MIRVRCPECQMISWIEPVVNGKPYQVTCSNCQHIFWVGQQRVRKAVGNVLVGYTVAGALVAAGVLIVYLVASFM